MAVEISYSREALKALRRSHKRELIKAKIEQLAADPESLSADLKSLKNGPEKRLRVQNWRIIFRIEDDVLHIDSIAPRGNAY